MMDTYKKHIDVKKVNRMAEQDPQGLIQLSEKRYRDQMAEIADRFAADFPQQRVILLSGPSSAGKTTTSHNLDTELEKRGISTFPLSLDDFFFDRDQAPLLPDGTPAPVGETGEIVIRTDKHTPCGLFMGYYQDEEKTREAWSDGVYHTGDTAWRDEDGYFFYVGRTDDVIKSSGYRIGPFEIESVIMELPYVLECAVTSAPDPIRGQVVKASIVLTKGTEGTEALKKEIQTYVKTNTAPYKYPRIVEFRDELPKTISGKIRRVELKG